MKRAAPSETLASESPRPSRRVKPTAATATPLQVTNIGDIETIHHQCALLVGSCPSFENSVEDYVRVKVTDSLASLDIAQNWPVQQGKWKALILLMPGNNDLTVTLHHAGGVFDEVKLNVNYQPLLQLPPLHLAIMVAKDSPLLIDCPPAKFGAFSSTHNGLEAAIAKFRMTAYMWQALTAEDMRQKGLGRRSFRLEEAWCEDTLTAAAWSANQPHTRTTAKVHIIRCDKTVAELRNSQYAQQNPRAREPDTLHSIFSNALKASGAPFNTQCRPVVAGMILDSHYALEEDMILAHAALGSHDRNGLSLGMFGSHLTYSWPRFLDEVPACLTDSTSPGDLIGNDNGECNTNSQACYIGQGAFLHEVGHAFGADHTTGIMARGYSKSWGHAILASAGGDDHEAKWDIQDCLRFKTMPHFRLPGEAPITDAILKATLDVGVSVDSDDDDVLCISSSAKLATVRVTNGEDLKFSFDFRAGGSCSEIRISDFSTYDRTMSLEIEALALNGVAKTIKNGWRLFNQRSYVTIPGTKVRLTKRSIWGDENNQENAEEYPESWYKWTVLLKKRSSDGSLLPASYIDLRVGCTLDGAVVEYPDDTRAHCGPVVDNSGRPHDFGGHLSESLHIPDNARIVKVEVGKSTYDSLDGLRMHLDNGKAWGNTNECDIETLEPGPDEEIVGFFGTSKSGSGFTEEFGILTAPKGRAPEVIYDMSELQNFANDDGDDEDDEQSQETMEG